MRVARAMMMTAALTTIVGVARADDGAKDDLFAQANQKYVAGDYAGADALYTEAFKKKPSHEIAANWGLTAIHLKKYREAAEHLQYALDHAPAGGNEDARAKMQAKLEDAKKEIGVLRVRVAAPACAVTLDGAIAIEDHQRFVDAGKHDLVARCDGYEDAARSFEIARGQSMEVALDPVKKKSRAPMIIAGASIAVVGIGAGVVFTILSNGKSADRQNELAMLGGASPCGVGTPNVEACDNVRSLSGDQNTLKGLAIAGYAVGGAAAIGTIVYVIASKPRADGPAASAALKISPSLGGLRLSGRF